MFKNTREIVIATYDKHSKPTGQMKTYLNSIDIPIRYSYIGVDGKENIQHEGKELKYLKDMKIVDDENGFSFTEGSAWSRINIRFTGLVCDGILVVGTLSFKGVGK